VLQREIRGEMAAPSGGEIWLDRVWLVLVTNVRQEGGRVEDEGRCVSE